MFTKLDETCKSKKLFAHKNQKEKIVHDILW